MKFDLCKWVGCRKVLPMPEEIKLPEPINLDSAEIQLRSALKNSDFPDVIHDVLIAQWKLETGHFKSKLCRDHNNYGGLKWRLELLHYATKVDYVSHEGYAIEYCKFISIQAFVRGYQIFITRDVYDGVWDNMSSGESYLRYIVKCGYCSDAKYINKVLALV